MVGFLIGLAINLAITIGLNVLSRLLQPGVKRPKPQPFEAPTAESGGYLGKGWGVYETHPRLVLLHQPTLQQDKHGDLDVTRYYAKMVLVWGWGPISILYEIISDERAVSLQPPGSLQSYNDSDDVPPDPNIIYPSLPFDFDAALTNGREFSINVRQMFGGGGEEGGLQGLFMLYPGYTDQPIDPLVLEVDEAFASAYPWAIVGRFGAETGRSVGISTDGLNQQGDQFYWTTNVPTPKPISLLVGSYPDALLEDGGRMGVACNAVEVIYEIYIDTKWGLGKPTSRFDLDQWRVSAERIRDEGLKISIPQDDPRQGTEIIEDVLRHIDGGVVEDPATGLLQLKLARPDYDFDDLLTIGAHNTENFKRGKPLAPKSLNDVQVRYRRFHGGETGEPQTELASNNLDSNVAWFKDGDSFLGYAYSSAGKNIDPDTAKAFIDDVEVPVVIGKPGTVSTPDVVALDPVKGMWVFILGSVITEGVKAEIEYVADKTFVAFVDDVATAQNIAAHQARGQHQPESYDYPFYIDPVSAQWKADRLRATLSRTIDTFTWEGKRDQSHLTPWDVVKLLEPEWGVTTPIAIRITKISRGTRTNPRLTFEGVLDIWGEQVLLSNIDVGTPPVLPPKLPAPAMGIACGVSGSIDIARIDLFPTDTVFAVEVWEADDAAGMNAVLISTIPAGTTPMFYEGSVGKYYAARQVGSFNTPGPFTPWITCEGTVDPPVDPTCILPTYTTEVEEFSGILFLYLTDPQNRVQLVEYRTRSGSGEWTAWTPETAPFCFSVSLSAIECSRIEWRISYIDCDGLPQQYLDGYDFCPVIPEPEPPPEPEPVFDQETEVVFHAGGIWPIGQDEIETPALDDRLPLTPWKGSEVKTPVKWATQGYIAASFYKADLPTSVDASDAYMVIRGRAPSDAGAIWRSLGPDDTPRIPLDTATLLAMDDEAQQLGQFPVCVRGDWADFRPEFLGVELHLAADIVGADGTVLQEVIPTRVSIWLRKGVVSTEPVEPPETGDPQPQDPGSCDVATPISMAAGTEEDEGGSVAWVRDTDSAELTISGGSGYARVSGTKTGLTPDEKHAFYVTVDTHGRPGVGAFLEAGGVTEVSESGAAEELEVIAYADGSGEIDYRFGVQDISGAGGAGALTVDLDDYSSVGDVTADGWSEVVTGSVPPELTYEDNAFRFEVSHPAWTGGSRYFEKYFPGFTPGAKVSATVQLKLENLPWFGNPIFTVGVTSVGLEYDKNAIGWQTLECVGGEIDDDGRLLIRWGAKSNTSAVEDFVVWFDGQIVVSIAGVGDIVIDFADLGYCAGSGKPGDGPDEWPDPPEVPDPPPGGWPEPPVPLTAWFQIWDIPVEGLGFWDATHVPLTPKNAANVLRECEENDTYIFMVPGIKDEWLSGGAFSETRWKQQFDLLYNDPEARAAIEDASTGTGDFTKVRIVCQIIDEPYHQTRYGGGGVSFAVVERLCIHSKTRFPDMETMVRVDPTRDWFVRKMVGCDSLWAEYLTARGPIDSWITSRIAAAQSFPHFIYAGLHWAAFDKAEVNRMITAAEIRYYGRDKIARRPEWRGLGGWKYVNGLLSDGRSAAIQEYRDQFALTKAP